MGMGAWEEEVNVARRICVYVHDISINITYHELIKGEANAHPAVSLSLQGECDVVSTDGIGHIVYTIWRGVRSRAYSYV